MITRKPNLHHTFINSLRIAPISCTIGNSQIILENLENKNILCVTVDELFDHYGVPLLPNQVYTSCLEQAAQ